jgi:hypothetical protein
MNSTPCALERSLNHRKVLGLWRPEGHLEVVDDDDGHGGRGRKLH